MNDWTVTPLAASLGARIDGVRLTEASEVELGVLQDLLDEHHLLLVSGQDGFSVADHIRVGESFGDPYVPPFIDAIPEHPAILQVIEEPDDTETFGGEFWHCDISYTSPPAAVSILHACELPPVGGDTLFVGLSGQTLATDFGLFLSVEFIAILLIGGAGTTSGAIVGAFLIYMMPQFVEEATKWLSDQESGVTGVVGDTILTEGDDLGFINTSTVTPGWTLSVFDWNIVLFGVLIIVFLIFEPLGMYGIWVKIRNYWKRWPFSY